MIESRPDTAMAMALLAAAVAEIGSRLEGGHDSGLRGRERFAPRAPVRAIDAGDLIGRNFIFGAIAPGEHDKCRESADQARR